MRPRVGLNPELPPPRNKTGLWACKGTRPVLSQSLEIQEPDVQGWSLEFTTIIILALQQMEEHAVAG